VTAERGPVVLRFADALAARGAPAGEAAPPLAWTGGGSVALTALRRAADVLAPALRPLDAVGDALAARPLAVAAAAVVVVPASQISGAPVVGIAAAAVAALALVVGAAHALHDGGERRVVVRALLAGAALRLAFAAAISAQGGFPDETGTYHPIAADAASCWRAGGPATMAANLIVQGRAAYFHLLAAVYFLFGPSMAAGRLFGAALGLAAALAAGEVGRALGGRRAAAFACAALALHPEHALWSATISRDTLTTLLVLATFAIVLRRPGTLLRGNLVLAAVPLALVAMNSFLVAGALAATLVLMTTAEAVAAAGGGVRRAATFAAAAVVAGAALVFVGARHGPWFRPDLIATVRGNATGSPADFLPGLAFGSWWAVAAYLPLGAAFVLAAPWPWDAVHANRAAYGLLALAGLAISAAGVAGLVAAARRRAAAAAPVVTFALVLLALLAALEGNSGIVVRHRLPLTACLACGAGVLAAGLRRAE
jgi:hypothetical protein